ncbi:MAG: helix-turn-helix domain-containing protein [Bacilli bacterium]|nr:helix-turn-helix domain-containing protein [Bacilli bacterium]
MWTTYKEMYDNIDNEKKLIEKRLEMVRFAYEHGIKVAARVYSCSKNTIKKWCRRYAVYGIKGLKDKSRRPHHSPKRIDNNDIIKIKQCVDYAKEKKKYITVNNVRRKTKITKYSDETINRYINESCNGKKNKKHIQPKKDVSWKQKIKPFMYWEIDIKYLTDIDNLKPYFKMNNDRSLAKYQITARDMSTGFPIVAYCDDRCSFFTKKFLEEILYPFLKQFKYLNLKEIIIQTDNGTEFTNKYVKTYGKEPKINMFTLFVEEKFRKHKTNPPACPTYDSDVETFHWSIERDCLAWDDIVDNESLIKYTSEYMNEYIHSVIKTRGYSPIDKIKETYDIDKIIYPMPQILSV